MSKTKMVFAVVLLGLLVTGAKPGLAAVPSYTITDLGSLGGASVARAVNNLGQVVGTYEPGLGKTGAFLWTPQAGMVNLPGLGGDNTFAYDINSAGQIVGGSDALGANLHAMLWDTTGNATDINPGPNYYSAAYAINQNGRAVLQGNVTTDLYGTHLILWDSTSGFTDHGDLSGTNAIGWDINLTDDVALMWEARGIRYDILGSPAPAFSWDAEDGLWFIPPLAGSRSGNSYSINDYGQVVGGFGVTEGGKLVWKAFIFTPWYPYESIRPYLGRGETTPLGTLGADTIAYAINNTAQIVGTAALANGDLHAFLWEGYKPDYDPPHEDPDRQILRDLNDLLVGAPAWVLNEAYGINDVGQIVGYGVNPAGETHAFLLTPVPEPASLAAIVAGVALLCPRPHRQRR